MSTRYISEEPTLPQQDDIVMSNYTASASGSDSSTSDAVSDSSSSDAASDSSSSDDASDSSTSDESDDTASEASIDMDEIFEQDDILMADDGVTDAGDEEEFDFFSTLSQADAALISNHLYPFLTDEEEERIGDVRLAKDALFSRGFSVDFFLMLFFPHGQHPVAHTTLPNYTIDTPVPIEGLVPLEIDPARYFPGPVDTLPISDPYAAKQPFADRAPANVLPPGELTPMVLEQLMNPRGTTTGPQGRIPVGDPYAVQMPRFGLADVTAPHGQINTRHET